MALPYTPPMNSPNTALCEVSNDSMASLYKQCSSPDSQELVECSGVDGSDLEEAQNNHIENLKKSDR